MIAAFEPIMSALFAHLQASVAVTFIADATATDVALSNVSTFDGLFPGLPVFGPGVPRGTTIQSLDEEAAAITLSAAPSTDGAGASFTTGFLTTGRRVEHWAKVPDQPALFLRRTGVTDQADHENFYSITTLECEAWIYCNAGQDKDIAPDEALTALEQMLRESFAPDGEYGDPRFTLGGLVHWCRFEGRSDISPGDQGPQAIARMPIRITIP